MIIMVPVQGETLFDHFGGAREFRLYTADEAAKTVSQVTTLSPPEHAPGVFPQWIRDNQADVVIVRGMGNKAQEMLSRFGVKVVTGAPIELADQLVDRYLQGSLLSEEYTCSHGHHDH